MADSSTIKILRHVWKCEGEVMGGRSWARLNDAMGQALSLAITCGMKMATRDFESIVKEFNFSYWGGKDRHMLGERFYSLACAVSRDHGENRSAAISFETWKQRPPFIYKDRHNLSGRRLAIGSEIRLATHPGERFWVKSFAEDGQSVGVASYAGEYGLDGKVKHRVKLTVDALREQNAVVTKAYRKHETEAAA